MALSLPNWNLLDRLTPPSDPRFGQELERRMRAVHENFEALVSQTESHLADSLVHESTEALGEVTTTSGTYVELSGGPEITVRTRPGLMVAVLLDSARMTC